jgi:hypothetical protein
MQMHSDPLVSIVVKHYGKYQQKTGPLRFFPVSLQQMQKKKI